VSAIALPYVYESHDLRLRLLELGTPTTVGDGWFGLGQTLLVFGERVVVERLEVKRLPGHGSRTSSLGYSRCAERSADHFVVKP
jgi:hypothetical protein